MSLNFSRQRSATITPRTGPSPNADSVTPRDGASAGSNSSFTDAALDSPSSTSGGDRALIQSLIRRQQQMVNELNTYRKLYAEHAQVKAELAEVRKLKSDADADITALSEKLETLRREGAVAEAKAAEASAEASEQRGKAASFEKLLGEERHYSRNREDELTALRVKLQEVSGELAVARSAQQDVDQLRQRLKEAEDAHTLTVSKLDGLAVENLQLANETDVLRLRLAEQSTALAEVKRQAESAAAMSHKASSNSGGVGEWECVQELRAQLANAQAALKEAEESAALDREAVRSSTQDLERLYRDFLVCCDTFNGAVASPPQSSDEAAQHLQTTNHALSNLASRLDVIVERDGGYAEEPHLKLLADVLSYAIHTTSAIQSHAAQGMCLEADLGDALYHDAEMSMLIAMRRVMKEQSGAAQRTR